MFSTLRTRFGIPGVISVIALVFAMLGGAYAANNSSNAGKATASAKAKKGPRGPKGATGPAGPQGPTGPQGPAGAKGDAGANGSNGTNGTNGTSAEAVSFSGAKGGCTEGGTEVKSAKPTTFVCNGKKGENGQTGFTETLPAGKTETGNWLIGGFTFVGNQLAGEISFPIPLSEPSTKVVYLNKSKTENSVTTPIEGCEFDSSDPAATPVAPPGTLCVFTQAQGFGAVNSIVASNNAPAGSDTPTGALIFASPEAYEGELNIFELAGTWAVTAAAS